MMTADDREERRRADAAERREQAEREADDPRKWEIHSRSGAMRHTCHAHRYQAIGEVDDRDLVTNVIPGVGECEWCSCIS